MELNRQMEIQGNWLFKYRGILPLFVFLLGLLIFLRNESNPSNWVVEGTDYEIIYEISCLFVSLVGFIIRVYTVGYTPPNTSGRNTERQVANVLNTKGIYSIMRNPLYVGNFFMWLGIAMLTGNLWFIIAFILLYFLYYERIIFTEERFLISKFGDDYLNWASKTPVAFPKFSNFIKNDHAFNWRKVLRQEKNGLAAVFLIFCLFDALGELVKVHSDFNIILHSVGIGAVLVYGILKFIKYRTKLLHDPD